MSSSPQKRSIKDHFKVIPSPLPVKKEQEPTIKLHPLFIKKPKAETVQKETKKENIAPPPPPPPPPVPVPIPTPPAIIKKEETSNIPLPPPKTKRKTTTRPNPFNDIIKADTQQFFLSQKKLRNGATKIIDQQTTDISAEEVDIETIEAFMDKYYTQAWKKQPCCQYLMKNLKTDRHHYKNNKSLWCDKYRPNAIEGLLGYLPDYEYARDWLERKKINSGGGDGGGSEEKDSTTKNKPIMNAELEDPFNLMLFVGDHGTGKTATVYTAAKETGYSVFEINSTSKRNGKEVLNQVGEMTASHLVRFDHFRKRKKQEGEIIILRDTVKKPRTIDIAMHFKKMVTVSSVAVEKGKQPEEVTSVVPVHTIESFFKATTTVPPRPPLSPQKKEEIMSIIQQQPKQSLVLLEEVDILFEQDKGFWPSVIELCQKSKRPFIMTCNDSSQIPFDHLDIQSILYFDPPPMRSLLPYLHLICFSEGYFVQPDDLDFLCQLFNQDFRKLIDTLQFWLSSKKNNYLFARIMGFQDLLLFQQHDPLGELLHRLKGANARTIELCCYYYFKMMSERQQQQQQQEGMQDVCRLLEDASFADAWVGLTIKQRHQIYDIDQYDNETDILLQQQQSIFVYKKPNDLDHWELGEEIEKSILALSWRNNNNNDLLWYTSHCWETLCHTRRDNFIECSKIISQLGLLSYPINETCLMEEYIPQIRSLCLYDQGLKGKGRSQRSRRKIRYLQLDDQSRDFLIYCGGGGGGGVCK